MFKVPVLKLGCFLSLASYWLSYNKMQISWVLLYNFNLKAVNCGSVNCHAGIINSRFIMIDIGNKYETEGMPLLHNESHLYKYQ